MELNMFEDKNKDDNTDKDIDNILAILRDIPQAAIPDEFEGRLHEALENEGRKIREERRTASKKRKWYIKAVAAAACFVVVFASVSVYNSNKGDLLQRDSYNDSAVSERAGDELASGSESIKPDDLKSKKPDVSIRSGDCERINPQKLQAENNFAMREETPLDSEPKLYGADALCVDDGKEAQNYIALIDLRLYGYEYELVSCEQDEASGDYRITVHISYDPKEENTDRQLVFVGRLGEIHEEQGKEESQINSD